MGNFLQLVGYEYKKVLYRKSAVILILLALVVTAFSSTALLIPGFTVPPEGESAWEAMINDREYDRALAGRQLDAELFLEASAAHAAGNPRPYNSVLFLMQHVFRSHYVTSEEAGNFYEARRQLVEQAIYFNRERNMITDRGADAVRRLSDSVATPFVFDYTRGFTAFFNGSIHIIVSAFIIAIGVAPIFAGEYKTGMSQLILTSKNGKGTLVLAKIFTAVTFSALISFLLIMTSFVLSMLIFGSDGASAQIQLIAPAAILPVTLGQSAIILIAVSVARALYFGTALLLLSSKLKSSFGVLIAAVIWLFLASMLFIPIPNIWLINFHRLFIAVLPFGVSLFQAFHYEILGAAIMPAILEPLFAVAACAILAPLAGRAFRRHQE